MFGEIEFYLSSPTNYYNGVEFVIEERYIKDREIYVKSCTLSIGRDTERFLKNFKKIFIDKKECEKDLRTVFYVTKKTIDSMIKRNDYNFYYIKEEENSAIKSFMGEGILFEEKTDTFVTDENFDYVMLKTLNKIKKIVDFYKQQAVPKSLAGSRELLEEMFTLKNLMGNEYYMENGTNFIKKIFIEEHIKDKNNKNVYFLFKIKRLNDTGFYFSS